MRKIVRSLALALVAMCGQAARAEVVVIVSAQSEVEKLSSRQVANIYMAKDACFPNGALALPMDMHAGTALRKKFYRRVVHRNAQQLRSYWSRRMASGVGAVVLNITAVNATAPTPGARGCSAATCPGTVALSRPIATPLKWRRSKTCCPVSNGWCCHRPTRDTRLPISRRSPGTRLT